MSAIITVIGRLGRDAEISTMKNGGRRARISIASNTGWGDNKSTTWYNCTIFGDSVSFAEKWCKRGHAFMLTGEHSMRKYTGRDGVERESNDIRVFNISFAETMNSDKDKQSNGGSGGGYQQGGYSQSATTSQPNTANYGSLRDDDDFPLDTSALGDIVGGNDNPDDADVPF